MSAHKPEEVRAEQRSRILSVMKSLDKPVTPRELHNNPLLSDLDARGIFAYLRHMHKRKSIVRVPGKCWKVAGEQTAVATITKTTTQDDKPYFVIVRGTQQILLDVGGLRLPVKIE